MEINKQTYLSEKAIAAIEEYQTGQVIRYRAEAIRQLIDAGLNSSTDLPPDEGLGTTRLPLAVAKSQHERVAKFMHTLPKVSRTFDAAYRLVIMKGLIASKL